MAENQQKTTKNHENRQKLKNHLKRKPPTFSDGSKAPRGRPDPQKDRFSVKSLNPNPPNPNPSAADGWVVCGKGFATESPQVGVNFF